MRKIEISNVNKKFAGREVLKNITMYLESGKIYGIVGHNGSGKTVLLKCICGFYRCDEGQIIVDGKEIGKNMTILTDAGIIIEEPGFIRGKSGYHNLDFLYTIHNKRNSRKIYEIMEKVGLNPKEKKGVEKYSLGMRQRLAIAQAIMENPSILLLDEPMNGLDKEGVKEMRELFLQMKEEGKLLILASHNREDISILCDEVYEMENGVLTKV